MIKRKRKGTKTVTRKTELSSILSMDGYEVH